MNERYIVWELFPVVATLAGVLLLSFLYVYFYIIERKRYIKVWALGWSIYFLKTVFLFLWLLNVNPSTNQLVEKSLYILSSILILSGAYELGGKKLSRVWSYSSIIMLVYALATTVYDLGSAALILPIYFYLSVLYTYMGIYMIRSQPLQKIGMQIIGWTFIVWGIHLFDYPFTKNIVWFAPVGYLITTILVFIIVSVMLINFFQETRQELYESEERYRLLFELSPFGIIVAKDRKVIMANREMARLYGVESPQDMIGRHKYELIRTGNDYRNIIDKRYRILTEDMSRTSPSERKIVRKDGSEVYWETSSVPFPVNDGVAVLSVVKDVTEIKRLDAMKKDAEEKEKLLKEAIELEKFRTEFFANLAHELRTPLNVILGTAQLFDAYAKKGRMFDPEDLTRHTRAIRQNCLRLLRLVNNLIDTTRIEAGFYESYMENHDIVTVIEDITLSVLEYISDKGLNLVFDTDIDEKVMAFDADKVERIMLNLLSNAVKFTGQDGSIFVNIHDNGDSVAISVRDTGCGIPEDLQSIIFERFRQVDKSLTRNHEGSGIGLSLVKSFTEMHGGKVSVYSELGNGSQFTVELPAKIIPESESEINKNIGSVMHRNCVERIQVEFSDIYM